MGCTTLLLVAVASWDPPAGRPDPTTTTLPPITGTTIAPAQLVGGDVSLPLVVTYYFYWYDEATGLHLRPRDPLPTHPVAEPPTSFRSVRWHRAQLDDMAAAGIDVVLPVYWGDDPDEAWSSAGLDALVEARHRSLDDGGHPPSIGMFYDSTILAGRDLTSEAGRSAFLDHIVDFFARVPGEDRALLDGRPVVWLFLPQEVTYDQRLFDATSRLEPELGARPFVVREAGWLDVETDGSFLWGSAQHGVQATDLVASVGPGYDERDIPGRAGVVRSRDGGGWYRRNLAAALASGRPLLAIETWNEFHEASGIGRSVEYGRAYVDITHTLIDEHRDRRG